MTGKIHLSNVHLKISMKAYPRLICDFGKDQEEYNRLRGLRRFRGYVHAKNQERCDFLYGSITFWKFAVPGFCTSLYFLETF